MNPYFVPHDEHTRQSISLPPHLQPYPGPPPLGGFAYSGPHPPLQPFSLSYPIQNPQFPAHFPPFMHQQYSHARSMPHSFLDDPAFSPDPRSNPHFFSMNDREEIYPVSPTDSLSDYAPTVPDNESEVDHTVLPPRMRILPGPDVVIPPRHARSQSTPYVSVAPLPQNPSRSNSARVIPIPPPNPITRASTPGSSRRKPSREHLPERPFPLHPSPSATPEHYWQPPPPYESDSESDSSSSSPQTPSNSPPSSSHHHLPRESKGSPAVAPPLPEKRSLSEPQPISSASSSSAYVVSQPRNDAPVSTTRTSLVNPPAGRVAVNPRNASAPELRPPPDSDVPPRPSTVPISAPPPETPSAPRAPRRKNSKNPSIATPPRDLDKIDELDESDPLGFAWHHGGPYEAIAKATASTLPPDSGVSAQRASKPKRKPAQTYDSVSVGVAPGQIFPSFSQYQPQTVGNVAQVDPGVLPAMPPAENFQVLSPPRSPLALPVQRRVPPTGQPPSTPDQYSNMHMNMVMNPAPPIPSLSYVPVAEMRDSRMPRTQPQQSFAEAQRAPERRLSLAPPASYGDAPQPSPPLPNPYSPVGSAFPDALPARRGSSSRPASIVQPHRDLPPSDVVPRPDISLPPQRQQEKSTSLLPRHLPKKLVMPAPLQQNQNQNLQPGQAHVEFLAERHGAYAPSLISAPGTSASVSSQQPQPQQQQQVRAQDIPISHGPKLLRKRHASSVPQSDPSSMPSNSAAAMFAAKVRFVEPAREETKEERKKREKADAKREKEDAKREKERAKMRLPPEIPLQGIFAVDYVKEAELAREREFAKMSESKASRKLSKRR